MMSRTLLASLAVVLSLTAGSFAASVSLTNTPLTGVGDISMTGILIDARNTGGGPSLNIAGINFQSGGNPLGNGFAGANPNGLPVGDANLISLLNTESFGAAAFNIPVPVIGATYEVQMFMTDNRGCCLGRTVTVNDGGVNSVTTPGIQVPQLITGTFTADSMTQTLNFNGSAALGYLGGYQLRLTSAVPSVAPGVIIDEDVEGNSNGWTGWLGAVAAGTGDASGLLPGAADIDDPALTSATAIPDALNVLNGNVPYINGTGAPAKTYLLAIEPGTYDLFAEVVNWNNASFPDPVLEFSGLTPTLVSAPMPASGDDEIWHYQFTVAEDDAIVGQLVSVTFRGTIASGNAGVDHVFATFQAPVPEPATLALLGLGGLAFIRRRTRSMR